MGSKPAAPCRFSGFYPVLSRAGFRGLTRSDTGLVHGLTGRTGRSGPGRRAKKEKTSGKSREDDGNAAVRTWRRWARRIHDILMSLVRRVSTQQVAAISRRFTERRRPACRRSEKVSVEGFRRRSRKIGMGADTLHLSSRSKRRTRREEEVVHGEKQRRRNDQILEEKADHLVHVAMCSEEGVMDTPPALIIEKNALKGGFTKKKKVRLRRAVVSSCAARRQLPLTTPAATCSKTDDNTQVQQASPSARAREREREADLLSTKVQAGGSFSHRRAVPSSKCYSAALIPIGIPWLHS
ncbi:hypothetical protein KSP40_PGU012629 [Platanthera guangdongensis]|uniref:Uncharacterized protein n=1 Tax=Platanthera guangdongensis TaxID=2320717 RepID=A0ABR2M912_9ASPA